MSIRKIILLVLSTARLVLAMYIGWMKYLIKASQHVYISLERRSLPSRFPSIFNDDNDNVTLIWYEENTFISRKEDSIRWMEFVQAFLPIYNADNYPYDGVEVCNCMQNMMMMMMDSPVYEYKVLAD